MPKWSSNTFPSKYRYLKKRIEAIEEAVRALPKPTIDFFALSPKERDLIEVYYRSLFKIRDRRHTSDSEQGLDDDQKESSQNELLDVLHRYLEADEIKALFTLLNNIPRQITKEFDKFWEREHPPHLMSFLSEQQDLYGWIPAPGRLYPAQLTWVAWDELVSLVTKYGYALNSDDISNLKSINEWTAPDKHHIVHLYLEMIVSEETRKRFLAVQNYAGTPPPIRKRLPLWNNERRYHVVNGKVVLLNDD